ncbi:hypothetical protein WJX84_003243 [Apatococcus fuscideae]|uniref:Uncharacterized protein n=1 Tax=Apatococcus fuscideae TaxID=2026836 RepID=A0AAW1T3M8_9CHLO
MMQQNIGKRKEEHVPSEADPGPKSAGNPYDNQHVMSLKEFIEHPLAMELLHDGQSYQVLGITNQSYWSFAASMRACLLQDADLRSQAAALAAKSLQHYLHVGITDRLDESVSSLAAALDINVELPAASGASSPPAHENVSDASRGGELPSLGRSYRACVEKARRKNAGRRAKALRALGFHDNSRLTFSAATRARIPPSIIARIRELNTMDATLYAEGVRLLSDRITDQKQRKLFTPLPTTHPGLPALTLGDLKDEL